LDDWQTYLGKPYNLQDEWDRYNKVTKEDVQKVFAKYVKDKHAAIVNVFPRDPDSKDSAKRFNPNASIIPKSDPQYEGLKYVKAKDNFDRSKKPIAGSPKLPVVPQYYTHELKNGVKLIGTQSSETPIVILQISIKGGDYVVNDPKKAGLAGLTAEVLNEGTKNYTAEEISGQLDMLGSSIFFGGGGESSVIFVTTLTKNLDATLKLLEEKLYRPRFDEKDFKKVKKQVRENLKNQANFPAAIAPQLYANLIFGNTPLGSYETEKTIKKLTLDDVKNYYAQYYSPAAASVVVVGDISDGEIMKKLDFLSQWKGKEVKMPDPEVVKAAFPAAQPTQIYLCDKRGSTAQSVIMMGYPSMPYDATGEYFKANVMNFSLGGSFNSRLNLNLREDKGYTYGIRRGFAGSKYPGDFVVSASVRRNATDSALTEIMKEIKKFKAGGLTDDDVTYTKNSILNSQALRYEAPQQKAGFLQRILEYNLTRDYPKDQAKVVNELTKNDLNALASKYINPDKMVILVVGNGFFIKDKIAKLGYKVKEVDLD